MSNLHIITVATHAQYYFPYLVESIKNYGNNLTVLGFNEKWRGFNWKFKKMISYLDLLEPNDIACFIDGYDVLCLRNLSELSDKFIELKNKHNCKIIAGFDNSPLKTYSVISTMYFGKCNKLLLNSGTYIGYVKDIIIVLNDILELNDNDSADDQILMTKYCNINKNKNKIYIDVNNEIFLTINSPLQDLSKFVNIENNKLEYNNQYPFFIHAPGSGYLDNVLLKLNYNLDRNINNELNNNFFKNKVILYIKHFIRDYYMYILLIMFLIIMYKLRKPNVKKNEILIL